MLLLAAICGLAAFVVAIHVLYKAGQLVILVFLFMANLLTLVVAGLIELWRRHRRAQAQEKFIWL